MNVRHKVPSVKKAVTALALAAILAGCVSIPHDGPVREGNGEIAHIEPLLPIAEGPRPDQGPTAIVNGFLSSTAAGVASDFTVAREYLTTTAADAWDPAASVVVFDSGTLEPEWDPASRTVSYTVPVASVLDDSGRMVDSADGDTVALDFQLTQNTSGQWRIAELDNGILLAQANFSTLFRPVSLQFASTDELIAVPELRWFPRANAATFAARELVEGPSEWLADAVLTGFPPGSALAVEAVVVTGGVATVELNAAARGSAAQRALAQEQLELTLKAIPDVTSVVVTSGGVPLAGDESSSLAPEPVPSEEAAFMAAGRLGLWDGADLWTLSDAAGRLPEDASSLATSYSNEIAAFLLGDDTLVSTTALGGGADSLVRFDPEAPPPEAVFSTNQILTGNDLVAPSIDRHNWVWTAEQSGSESLIAARVDGTRVDLSARWLAGRAIEAVSVSRDGARVAVLSTEAGQVTLEVAGVVRDGAGTPVSVGEPLRVGTSVGASLDISWLDGTTLAVLGAAADEAAADISLVSVGGWTTEVVGVPGAVAISARNGEASLTLVADDGTVRRRAGNSWATIAEGIDELTYGG